MLKSDIKIVKEAAKQSGWYKYNDEHIFRRAYEVLTSALESSPKKTTKQKKGKNNE